MKSVTNVDFSVKTCRKAAAGVFRFLAWSALGTILLSAHAGRADQTAPAQFIFQSVNAHRTPPYTITGTVPPFSELYSRPTAANIIFFHALTISKSFTNSGAGTAAYTVDGMAGFSLAFDGVAQASNTLSIHYTGNVGPGQTGIVGDTAFANLSVPLTLGTSPTVSFSSLAATQVTAGATVETFGSVSVVYDYTPIGQSEQDPIPPGSPVNGVSSLAAAPSGRWYGSPTAARVRYDIASSGGSFNSIGFPVNAAGTFRVLADGQDYGSFQPGSTASLAAGTRSVVISRSATGDQEGAATFPVLLTFDRSAVDLNISSFDPLFFTGETALSNGVYYLQFTGGTFFGYYSFLGDPRYIYHFDLGYEYVFDAADGRAGVYLYDFKSGTFFYTSPTFPFPYLYDFTLNAVLYYYPDPNNAGRYNTNGVRYFYNFATGQIITK